MKKTIIIAAGILIVLGVLALIFIQSKPTENGKSNDSSLEHICTQAESSNYACTRDYNPVCGKLILNVGETIYKTFGNGCTACSSMKVVSYVPGECQFSSEQPIPIETGDNLIGGQRDAMGCLGPAGYSWNESEKECVRQWESGSDRYQINSYQTCVDAGYPIMESYPEQCKTPSGRAFTNAVEGKKPAIQYDDFSSKIVYKPSEIYSIEDYKNDCAARQGTFNECGSVCAPDAEVCVMMCAFTCENL